MSTVCRLPQVSSGSSWRPVSCLSPVPSTLISQIKNLRWFFVLTVWSNEKAIPGVKSVRWSTLPWGVFLRSSISRGLSLFQFKYDESYPGSLKPQVPVALVVEGRWRLFVDKALEVEGRQPKMICRRAGDFPEPCSSLLRIVRSFLCFCLRASSCFAAGSARSFERVPMFSMRSQVLRLPCRQFAMRILFCRRARSF